MSPKIIQVRGIDDPQFEKTVDLHCSEWNVQDKEQRTYMFAKFFDKASGYIKTLDVDGEFAGYSLGMAYQHFDDDLLLANLESITKAKDMLGDENLRQTFHGSEVVLIQKFRGNGFGKALLEDKINFARNLGYQFYSYQTKVPAITKIDFGLLGEPLHSTALDCGRTLYIHRLD